MSEIIRLGYKKSIGNKNEYIITHNDIPFRINMIMYYFHIKLDELNSCMKTYNARWGGTKTYYFFKTEEDVKNAIAFLESLVIINKLNKLNNNYLE